MSKPRKTRTPYRKPQIGEVLPGGTVVKILPPKGKNRSTRVRFRCARCKGLGECRYGYLVTGRQMSCGCGSIDQCRKNCETRATSYAAAAPAAVVENIAAIGEVSGPSIAAEQTGLDQSLVSTLWRLHRNNIFEKIDHTTREQINAETQRVGYAKTAAKFSLPVYIVMLVSRISRRIGKAAREAAAIATGKLRDAVDLADGAMNALVSMPGRYRRGEFSKAELPAPSKANRSPIYRAYAFLKSSIIPTSMQTLVGDFTSAVENTFAARKRRSLKFVRNSIRPEAFGDGSAVRLWNT